MKKNTSHMVTAVIPCYNDGTYILEALNSVLEQTVPPEKVIIVDDGSRSDTLEVLHAIKNECVEILFQTNQGVCVARNNGIARAKTTYILTLDADDAFEPTFVEKALKVLNRSSQVGVVCSYYKEFGKAKRNEDVIKPSGFSVSDFLVKNNGVASSLFRKKCWEDIGGYDERFKNGYEDWDFWLSILRKGWFMEVLKEPLFRYRKKTESRDTKAAAKFDQELRIQLFDKHKEVYRKHFDTFVHQMIWRNNNLLNTLDKTKRSKEYQIGTYILMPLRGIKQLLFSKNG